MQATILGRAVRRPSIRGRRAEVGSATVAILVLIALAVAIAVGARAFGHVAVERYTCEGNSVQAIGAGGAPSAQCGRPGAGHRAAAGAAHLAAAQVRPVVRDHQRPVVAEDRTIVLLAGRISRTVEIELTVDAEIAVEKARKMAKKYGAEFTGDRFAGRFSGKSIEGHYTIEGTTVRVTIEKKPDLVPWPMVEKAIRGFF